MMRRAGPYLSPVLSLLLLIPAACSGSTDSAAPDRTDQPTEPAVLDQAWWTDPRPPGYVAELPHCIALVPFDADGDGDLDLYAARALDAPGPLGDRGIRDVLLINEGLAGFVDKTDALLPFGERRTSHVEVVDFDKDGRLDLVLSHLCFEAGDRKGTGGQTRILRNVGKDGFEDVTAAWKLPYDDEDGASSVLVGHFDDDKDARYDVVLARKDRTDCYMQTGAFFFEALEDELLEGHPSTALAKIRVGVNRDVLVMFHGAGTTLLEWNALGGGFLLEQSVPLTGLDAPTRIATTANTGLPGRMFLLATRRGVVALAIQTATSLADRTAQYLPAALAWPNGPEVLGMAVPDGPFSHFLVRTPTGIYRSSIHSSVTPLFELVRGLPGPGAACGVDLDGDGTVELALGLDDPEAGPYDLLWAEHADGTVGPVLGEVLPYHDLDGPKLVLDVEGDGAADLLVVEDPEVVKQRGESHGQWRNDGFSGFERATWTLPPIPRLPCIAEGDLDGDGDLDIAVGNVPLSGTTPPEKGELVWWERRPGPAFVVRVLEQRPFPTTRIALADLDGDGDLDVLAAGPTGAGTTVVRLVLNRGDGTFDELALASLVVPSPTISALVRMDVDGDGDLEILVAGDRLHVFDELAPLRFAESSALFWPAGVDAVYGPLAVGDVDGEPGPELLASTDPEGTKPILLKPDGPGRRMVEAHRGRLPRRLVGLRALVDLDGDGDLDAFGSEDVFWNEGGRLGLFASPLPAGTRTIEAVADFDGDGDLDILAVMADGSHRLLSCRHRQVEAVSQAVLGLGLALRFDGLPDRGRLDALALPLLGFEPATDPLPFPPWGGLGIGGAVVLPMPVQPLVKGSAATVLPLPEDSSLHGLPLVVQALVVHDPGRLAERSRFTNRVVVTVR
ncbi:MAG: VCBS repeat-containing protein [Planctomycetota bacterium]